MKAATTCVGPSNVPIAANNFTSPAPVAPITWPGSISRRPIAHPASAPATVTPDTCDAASATPSTAVARVSWLGTRRVRTSIAEAAPALSATAAKATGSEILSNGLPEHVVDRVPDRCHGADRHDRDERHQ